MGEITQFCRCPSAPLEVYLVLWRVAEKYSLGWEGPAEEEPAVINSVPADRVQRLLQALPKRCQEVLTYRFLLNLSIKDTALRMGMTVPSVKVLQFRALKRAAELQQAVKV